MSTPGDESSPLRRLLDTAVYAPLGLLLNRDSVRDDMAQAGRKQVAFARSLGQTVLKTVAKGRADSASNKAASQAQDPSSVANSPSTASTTKAAKTKPATQKPAARQTADKPAKKRPAAKKSVAKKSVAKKPAANKTAAKKSTAGVSAAVAGYDDMTAREIVTFLKASATAKQATWVTERETAGKQRVTILRAASAASTG